MPSSDPKKPTHTMLEDLDIKDMSSVRQYANAQAGAQISTVVSPGSKSKVGGHNIVTVEMPKEHLVQQFEPGKIHDTKGIRYSDVTRGVSPALAKAGSRFRVNELTRGPLSIEAEEEQRIETEVQKRVAARLEELRDQVTREAHKAGFDAGRREVRQEVLAELQPKLKQFDQIVHQFEGMKGEIFKANEDFLLHMINQITRAVVLRELKDDKEYTRRIATHLLEKLGTRENIKIFVSEAELSAADTLKEGLAQTLGELKNISIEADPAVKLGGCRIETEFGDVDGRIEVQLQSIATGLGTALS